MFYISYYVIYSKYIHLNYVNMLLIFKIEINISKHIFDL